MAKATVKFPSNLLANAWTGEQAGKAALDKAARNFGLKERAVAAPKFLVAPAAIDRRQWQHPQIGWGLILPENDALSEADRARGLDAAEPLRELLKARPGAPVFRYRADIPPGFLRRYYTDRGHQDISITSAGERGIGVGQLPWYLLIAAAPAQIPWRLQYLLNQAAYVGRLDLDEPGLANYVNALLTNWTGMACQPTQPVVWAVDHSASDITHLMRTALADPVAEDLGKDSDIGAHLTHLSAKQATLDRLTQTLSSQQPALVISTSHGMTGPLGDPTLMAAQLGLLVDQMHQPLDPATLLAQWQPNGAIWYAHACCSAGSDGASSYAGLLEENSTLDKLLRAVAALGSLTAPLPQQLLGATKPLRAFIGQVEPTFDWTLRQPQTGQMLTATLRQALYNHLFDRQPYPIGLAFAHCYAHVGQLLAQWEQARQQLGHSDAQVRELARYQALVAQLTALDRQSMVILGDPTATIPPLQ